MDIKQFVRIKLESEKEEDIFLSNRLAVLLSLPPPVSDVEEAQFYFLYNDSRLELYVKTAGELRAKALFIDFLSGSSLYRLRSDFRISQPLAKAVGIKSGVRPTVCDVTAGFGADSFVIASFGCTVTMVERSPLIWALLEDAIRRAESNPQIGAIFKKHLSLYLSDGNAFIRNHNYRFDTIYMDPMYPTRKKSALSTLKMRTLRTIVGDDDDSTELLETARQQARKRVVVKRPGGAPSVGKKKPAYTIHSKNSRYDIYLTRHL